ncbi:MAG: PilN domain-containing protein [Thiomargarita sp.]|nr:PilN domain-containing protein [Thiomargarita sp.]
MEKIKTLKQVKKLHRHKKLLKKIPYDVCLIVYGNNLIFKDHQVAITRTPTNHQLSAIELAIAAQNLLIQADIKKTNIALALPSSELIATKLKLPAVGVNQQNIKSVVNLQLPNLLPGLTEQLLLAVQVSSQNKNTFALWLSAKRAEELWQAFNDAGLLLSCILPRSLVALSGHTKELCQVYDEDDDMITCLEWSPLENNIQRWIQVSKHDCDFPELNQQLDESLSKFNDNKEQIYKKDIEHWQNITVSPMANNYAFFPASMIAHINNKKLKYKKLSLVFIAMLLIASLAGGAYFAKSNQQELEQHLTDLRKQTRKASQLNMEITQMTEKFAIIQEFPKQDIVIVLAALNNFFPKNSWITSFKMQEGTIKLEGYSPEPNQLIEVLSEHPNIYDVVQSRDSVREKNKAAWKFGISFKLKGYNTNYQKKYFIE